MKEQIHPGKRRVSRRAAAFCCCLILIAAATVTAVCRAGLSPGRVISAYKTGASASASYPVPKPGTWLYVVDVAAALEKYAGREVTYLLAFNIFPNESDAMKGELERLSGLGYEVGYIDTWTYRGEGEKVHQPVAAGYFTAEQLENFPAGGDYGYAFHFIKNGDGTPVDARQELITQYSFGDGFGAR